MNKQPMQRLKDRFDVHFAIVVERMENSLLQTEKGELQLSSHNEIKA